MNFDRFLYYVVIFFLKYLHKFIQKQNEKKQTRCF